jgi:DNA-directed RNA polymerase sigma subunit (sigma70/sigma32)
MQQLSRRDRLRLERRGTAKSMGVGAGMALRTQAEVAVALGISRARVKQLEQSGLEKLRRALVG